MYLLEYGIGKLDEPVKAVAEALFLMHLSWEKVMKKQCLSRMTVCRYRETAINQIVPGVDSYMDWKVRRLFA